MRKHGKKTNHNLTKSIVIGLLLMAWLPMCLAAVVNWQLQGVTFDDAGTATGSFSYDADTNIYSNVSITTTPSGTFGATYTLVGPGFSANRTPFLDALPALGNPFLGFVYLNPLTNAGGTIGLTILQDDWLSSLEGICGLADCSAPNSNILTFRSVTAGSVSTVPIPAAVWLFGSALGLLGWMRRKKV